MQQMFIQLNSGDQGVHKPLPVSGLLGTHVLYQQPTVNPDCVMVRVLECPVWPCGRGVASVVVIKSVKVEVCICVCALLGMLSLSGLIFIQFLTWMGLIPPLLSYLELSFHFLLYFVLETELHTAQAGRILTPQLKPALNTRSSASTSQMLTLRASSPIASSLLLFIITAV